MKWLKSATRIPASASGALCGLGCGGDNVGRSGFGDMTFSLSARQRMLRRSCPCDPKSHAVSPPVGAFHAARRLPARGGALGFSGMSASNALSRGVSESDLVPVDQPRGMLDRVRDDRDMGARGASPFLPAAGTDKTAAP